MLVSHPVKQGGDLSWRAAKPFAKTPAARSAVGTPASSGFHNSGAVRETKNEPSS